MRQPPAAMQRLQLTVDDRVQTKTQEEFLTAALKREEGDPVSALIKTSTALH